MPTRLHPLRIALAGALVLALGAPASSPAEDVPVPVPLQADLLFMIAAHDRNLLARADGEVRTLILTKASDGSARAAKLFATAAARKAAVAGLPHVEEVELFTGAAALAEACRSKRASIVYLTPGFDAGEAAAIGRALAGTNVLTVAAAPSIASRGVVLGFDLLSGRAKLVLDPVQAAKQRVAFSADVLALMAVPR